MSYAPTKWWDENTVAVVTGANKGIGLEIAKALRGEGVTVVVTARDAALGQAAAAVVSSLPGAGAVHFHQLDITDGASIAALAAWLKDTFPNGVDALVCNAGFAYKGSVFGASEAKVTLDTNFRGTVAVMRAVAPMLKDGTGRVVVVSSRAGTTRIIPSQTLLAEITSADGEQLEALGRRFVDGIAAGKHEADGWPSSMYGVSKLLLSMATRVMAQELKPRGIAVNACCPGWCQTDMSSNRGPSTAAQGADTPTWLALHPPDDFVTGGFFGERRAVPF
ncbi:hypothetical protein FOA52_014721 [Chlamydomonas sp. UWO 241]|nr:hypothetical protein FOA52_014721 [Chlamydomonas sp. UWO 241]